MTDLIVRWQSKITGRMGQGLPMAKELAIAWMVRGNLECPEVGHRVDRVDGHLPNIDEQIEWHRLAEAERRNVGRIRPLRDWLTIN